MQAVDLVISDPILSRALTEQLEATDLLCAAFSSLAAAVKAWRDRQPSLIVIDADLLTPDDERALADAVSALAPTPRLLFLGTPCEAGDLPRTEIFAKPLRLGALLSRLRLLQNTAVLSAGQTYSIGPWLFAPDERLATKDDGSAAHFTEKESALLAALCATPEPLAKERLLADVWGYDASTDTHTLETHLYKLRRKLASDDEDPFDVDQGSYALKDAWRPA
jgi:DNA-binding response OmpR family regulator